MEIKDRILDQAAALFMRNGIKSVSMDDIATSLAMSKKTLYKWFAYKDEMVHAVMAQHLTGTQRDCTRLLEQSSSAIDENDFDESEHGEHHPHRNSVHHALRANSSIMQLKKLLGTCFPARNGSWGAL